MGAPSLVFALLLYCHSTWALPPDSPRLLCRPPDSRRWGSGSTPLSSLPTATPSFSLESTLTTPFPASGVAAATLRAHQTTANHAAASSYTLVSRGISLSADTFRAGTFAAATTVRTLTDLSPAASLSVREEAGTSTLTALTHTIEADTRDSAVGPTTGWRAGLTSSLAGLLRGLGDVRHARFEADAQGHAPVGASGITASVAVRAGAAVPWGGDPAIRLADRFYLGGPASLRGFAVRGVGPVDGKDALGGDLYYAATAMLTGPSPRGGGNGHPGSAGGAGLAAALQVRPHLFVTAGDVGNVGAVGRALRARAGVVDAARGVAAGVVAGARVAVGVGLAVQCALGRVEVNAVRVVRAAASDTVSGGLQLGLMQSFG